MSNVPPLSDQQVLARVPPPCRFISDGDMDEIHDLSQLLPKTLILYELHQIGHFCCVFENRQGINFFDPMGSFPDDELDNADPNLIWEGHQDYTYLLKLLLTSKKPVLYNPFPLQGKGTNTCGYWCGVRMAFKDMTVNEFADSFMDYEQRKRDRMIVKLFESL